MKISKLVKALRKFELDSCIFVTLGEDDKPYCVTIENIRQVADANSKTGISVLIRAFEIQQGRCASSLDDPEWFLRDSSEEFGLTSAVIEALTGYSSDAEVFVELGPDHNPYQVKIEAVSGFDDVALEDEWSESEDCISVGIRAYEIPANFVPTAA
ncbi:hypothetical protein LCG56_29300 (plasmid) [Pseudomonas cannabina pv. alisalensis]|uniref:Uncharacterized protein n=1 Tax=Pseudomonas syringae pv. maculicola str. ES4326 TaxID=629265 RepID=A0A8T8CB37_PSEYM|nr:MULTISPECIES: hypothetical protein [Pseudomonas syringae group]QHF00488.1 hypothetical protein PMA4326_028645 [Pseudomonas syringae pv. maculicola str. ES4326]UBZ00466.1 hypothetical protein LCG56_29300 [Pseudomonas cannabina pv. alisalensis]